MEVCFEHRDLGGHLDSTSRRTGTTMTKRFDKTTGQCRAHAQIPGGMIQRYHLAVGKYLPMALYGASTCLENWTDLNKLAGAIIGILKDVDLDPADYAEVEVRPGEVVHQDLQDTDYALVFDGDAFIGVNPGLWARTQITGWDRKVANVYARGDEAAPQHTMWAIWASN